MGSLHATHVVTVEHLAAKDGTLHPVQQAMVDCHGSQCGFCTPGFVMSLYGLWLSNEKPGRAEIEKALQGNLCRCTGYEPIVKAAEAGEPASAPSALFDPLEKTRSDIVARLWAMQARETIIVDLPMTARLHRARFGRGAGRCSGGRTDRHHRRRLHRCRALGDQADAGAEPVVFINHLSGIADDQGHAKAASPSGPASPIRSAFDSARAQKVPALAALIDRIGGEQVRNMGTIGGNIANGSPIGDTPAAADRARRDRQAALRRGRRACCRSRTSSSPMASRTAGPANSSKASSCPTRPRAAISPSTRSPSAATRISPPPSAPST